MMTLALAYDDIELDSKPRTTSRTKHEVKRPPPVGWRIEAFQLPHVRKQLMRRYSHIAFAATEYAIEVETYARQLQNHEKSKEAERLKREFFAQSNKWREDTAFTSSISDIILHPSYQRIIGLGPAVVPLILQQLQTSAEYWFWALEAITGQDPVPDAEKGRTKLMAKRWLDWAKAEKIIE